jgi:hypothetical protein
MPPTVVRDVYSNHCRGSIMLGSNVSVWLCQDRTLTLLRLQIASVAKHENREGSPLIRRDEEMMRLGIETHRL